MSIWVSVVRVQIHLTSYDENGSNHAIIARRSKRKCRPSKPSGQEFAPQRKVWNQDQDGYWYPNQDEDTDELGSVESSDQEEKQK